MWYILKDIDGLLLLKLIPIKSTITINTNEHFFVLGGCETDHSLAKDQKDL